MRESDLVATMTIHYTSDGEGAVVAGANTVAAAQDKVAASAGALATATESTSRRQVSAAASFDQMASRMSPAVRAMADLQRNIDAYGKALANNSSITDRAGQGLDVYREKINAQRAAVEALIQQQEILASQQRAAANTPVNTQDAINKSLGIDQTAPASSAKSSAGAFFSQADIQAQTKAQDEQTAAVNRLRAAINPLQVEQGKLGSEMAVYKTALQQGKISTEDYAKAQEMAGRRLSDFEHSLKQTSGSGRVLSGEMTNLGYQLNDVITGFVLGQSPMMILGQQGGQIIQIFTSAKASIAEFAQTALSWLTRSALGISLLVTGTVAALLGIDQALTSNGQAAERAKGRLDALGGVKLGDEYSKSLEKLTKSLGTTREELQPTFEAMLKLSGQMEIGFGRSGLSAGDTAAAIRTIFQELKLGGADTKTAADETGKFFDDLIKKQGLTGEALRRLQAIAPGAANAITMAMTDGRASTALYAAELDKVPEPIIRVMDRLHELTRSSDAAFKTMRDNPRNVTDAMEKLSQSFSSLWDKITGGDKSSQTAARVSLLTRAISGVADGVTAAAPAIVSGIETTVAAFSKLWEVAKNSIIGEVFKLMVVAVQTASPVIVGAIDTVKSAISSITDPINSTIAAIKGFVDLALGYLNNLAQGAISAAQKTASAIASIVQGGSGGAAAGNTNAMGDVGGGTGGSLTGYATGGQFTVKGPGGTDSEHVEFMASPGEVVTITPPGGIVPQDPSMGAEPKSGGMMKFADGGQFAVMGDDARWSGRHMLGGPSLAGADVVASHLAQNTQDQTANLKEKLDSVAAKIVDAIQASSNYISNTVTAALDKMAADANAAAAASQAQGRTTSFSGTAANNNSSFMSNSAFGAYPLITGSGMGAGIRYMDPGLTPGAPILMRYGGGRSSLIGGLNTSGIKSSPWSYSGGSPSNESSTTATAARPQMINGVPFYGSGEVGGQGSSVGYGGGSTIGSGFQTGGANANFASGGQFTVGGDGGIDTTPVRFNATRGEVVTISPSGPTPKALETAGMQYSTPSQQQQGSQAAPEQNKYVTIVVQQGVQADSFIRSRAEVARAAA